MSEPLAFDAVILAGGPSSRLGQPKQLVTLGQDTLLERAVDLARDAGARVTHVVLGAHADKCRSVLRDHDVTLHINPEWQRGQATTLALGLQSAADAPGVLVMVCDQYRLAVADLTQLVKRWRASPQQVVAARYGTVTGVPVLWPAAQARMVAGSGQAGKDWLAAGQPLLIDMPNAAFDLDTAEDLAALRRFARTAG